jgi:hypothetical protein
VGNPYNGYSWNERMAKFKEMQRRIANGKLAAPSGPCRLCNDPGEAGSAVFEYHDEDYSHEYSWSEPAAFVLCRDCHIYRVHQRSRHVKSWLAFLEHVRRGGYAREMRNPEVKAELAAFRAAVDRGHPVPQLTVRRTYPCMPGREWFAELSVESRNEADPLLRPRP